MYQQPRRRPPGTATAGVPVTAGGPPAPPGMTAMPISSVVTPGFAGAGKGVQSVLPANFTGASTLPPTTMGTRPAGVPGATGAPARPMPMPAVQPAAPVQTREQRMAAGLAQRRQRGIERVRQRNVARHPRNPEMQAQIQALA